MPKMHKCEDCGHLTAKPDEMEDPLDRVEPGEIMPSGQCPECGAVCHPVKEKPAKALKRALDHLNSSLAAHKRAVKAENAYRESQGATWESDDDPDFLELERSTSIYAASAHFNHTEAQACLLAMLREAGIIGNGTLAALI